MSGCPSENELLELSEGRASEAVRAHLLACVECQDVLGTLAGGARIAPGERVGRYQLRGTLGAGAMGVVYDAWDPELERPVALKLVRAGVDSGATTAELHARLKSEAQAMARLADPHVVAVFDVGRLGEQVFVAMEQVRGGTLASWLHERPRTADEILSRLVEAGRGLAAAHRAGLIHRDFKPENVLIGEDGRARVTDFGLARLAPTTGLRTEAALSSAHVTRTGVAVGTPVYMAPEQLEGRTFDARADVFAFAVTCFEALAGVRPWSASTFEGLVQARRDGVELRSSSRVPRSVRRAIEKGLALDPAQRWATLEDFLTALDPVRRRRRRMVGGLVLSAVAMLAAVAWIARPRVDCDRAAEASRGTWNDATRAALAAQFEATQVTWARQAFESVARRLDARTSEWQTQRTQACVAALVEGTDSAELYSHRVACLEDRLRQTRGLLEFLAHPDAALLERTSALVDALEPVSDCQHPSATRPLDVREKARVDEAMASVERARLLRTAGRYAEGLEVAASAVTSLTPRGPVAAALVMRGLLEEELMRYPDAFRTYQQAVEVGLAAREMLAVTDALFQLSGISGYRFERIDEALRFLAWGRAALGDVPDERRHAKYFERLSLLEWSLQAEPDQAQRDYAKYLAITAGLTEREGPRFEHRHGPAEFDMGHFDVALQIFEAEEARLLREYGPTHPELLEATENKAEVEAILGKPDEAVVALRELLTRFPERAAGYTNHRLGEALRRGGHFTEALVEDERALEAMKGEDAQSATWAQPLTGKGLDLIELGRSAEAIEPLERAVTLRMASALTAPRGEAHFGLARALWESGRDRQRAVQLAALAEDELRAADAKWHSPWFARWADSVASWRAEHRP